MNGNVFTHLNAIELRKHINYNKTQQDEWLS